MNIKPRPAGTLRSAILRAVRTAVLCILPFLVLPFLPVTQNVVAPEHGAAAHAEATRTQRDYAAAMERCDTLPAGTLPGAAVIGWKDGSVDFTRDADAVDFAFRVALGKAHSPRVVGVTLCR